MPPFRTESRPVNRPPELVDGQFLCASAGWLLWGGAALLLIGGNLTASFFSKAPCSISCQLFFFAGILIGRPGSMMLDLRERQLILGGFLKRKKEISLADVRMLCLAAHQQIRLDAFRRDGIFTRRVSEKTLPQRLELLPDIAEQMGRIPVSFSLGFCSQRAFFNQESNRSQSIIDL